MGPMVIPALRTSLGRTDVQTGRQADRILIARPRLHSMQRGKISDE